MTTTATDQRWWPTTWGRLAPGDEIQAPNGSVWVVGSAITSDGAGEWQITSLAGSVWTPHRENESVNARRPDASGGHCANPEVLLGQLRAVLGTVEPVSAVVKPGANRWVGCGGRVCTCRW